MRRDERQGVWVVMIVVMGGERGLWLVLLDADNGDSGATGLSSLGFFLLCELVFLVDGKKQKAAESVDRTRDLKIFSLTLSQLSYFGLATSASSLRILNIFC